MASTIFCCSQIEPYPRRTSTDHDHKFNPFIDAGLASSEAPNIICSSADDDLKAAALSAEKSFAIQLVRQVNYGPLESTRYFTPSPESAAEARYIGLSEKNLIAANFIKVNSYKNFKCVPHNRFFEVNLYQKDPLNKHHWRANIARPAGDIDL